jgi:hypothetical protein
MMPLNNVAYHRLPPEDPLVMYVTDADGNRVPQAHLIDQQPREPHTIDEKLDLVQDKVISLLCTLYPALTCGAVIFIISKYLGS